MERTWKKTKHGTEPGKGPGKGLGKKGMEKSNHGKEIYRFCNTCGIHHHTCLIHTCFIYMFFYPRECFFFLDFGRCQPYSI